MTELLVLALAGGLGAAGRYLLSRTVVVNLLGALGAGCMAGWVNALPASIPAPAWASIVTLGFLGAFTTYSTWSLEGVEDFRQGNPLQAVVKLAGTLTAGVALAGMGWWLTALIA
ncbi:MAG: CrcB family protein [Gemmatimonadota bacterium]